ncbi:MAG: glycosyltransferase family 4 protein [Acidobacteriota bacterium]|nr:glycosyltransferase family 4 protein [Acidobacteriota bacterium]
MRQKDFHFRYLPGINLGQTRIAFTLPFHLFAHSYDVYIKCINGKFALPLTYLVARLRRKPFILRTGVWTDLKTPSQRLLAPLVRHLYRNADAIVTYGEHVKRYLESKGVPSERIFVAPHAVDNSAYNRTLTPQEQEALRARLNLRPEQRIILFLGRLVASKGCMDLMQAFAELQDKDAVLLLVGEGPEHARMEDYARRNGFDGRVRFTGYKRPEEVFHYYSISYAMVISSITTDGGREPWALTVNEAFNAGVPVIASNAVGAAAGGLVQDGVNGFVVPERDPASLCAAMQHLLDDPRLHNSMSAAARQKIAHWTQAGMADAFMAAVRYVSQR